MAKKIDDGKSQIVLIAAIIIIAAVMIFGMFSKGGKSSEKSAGKAKNVKISQNNGKKSSKTKKSKEKKEVGCATINSTLFLVWWLTHSSCYNLNSTELYSFNLNVNATLQEKLVKLNQELTKDVQNKSKRRVYVYKTTGRVEYDEFYMKLSKPIIDEIDKVLARHYGFTEEELDFIINYDIKYRMGDELNEE